MNTYNKRRYLGVYLIIFTSVFISGVRQIIDFDIWWHLKAGQVMCQAGRILTQDIFSYTFTNKEWINPDWLSQVILYNIYLWQGIKGLIFARTLVAGIIFVLIGSLMINRKLSPLIALCFSLAAYNASYLFFLTRPLIFGHLLLTVFFYLTCQFNITGKKAYLFALPLICLLWANIHPSFIISPVILIIFITGNLLQPFWGRIIVKGKDEIKTAVPVRKVVFLCITLIFCIAVLFINPSGWKLFTYPFKLFTNSFFKSYIAEWMPPGLRVYPFFTGLLFLTGLIMILSLPRMSLCDFLLYISFVWLSLNSRRHIPLFALVSVPVAALQIPRLGFLKLWGRDISENIRMFCTGRLRFIQRRVWGSLVFLVPVGLVITLALGPLTKNILGGLWGTGLRENRFPVFASDFILEARLPGPLYNAFYWGGYLIWRLYPDYKVFIDGRTLLYGEEFMKEEANFRGAGPGWDKFLEKYHINFIVLNFVVPVEEAIRKGLAKNKDWAVVYWDDINIIYLKNTPANKPWLDKYAYYYIDPYLKPDQIGRTIYSPDTAAQAIKEYTRAVSFNPALLRAHLMLGVLYFQTGQLQSAEAAYNRALEINPGEPLAYNGLGTIMARYHEYDKALVLLSEAIKKEGKFTEAYYNRALVYESTGRVDKAVSDYLEAVKIKPDFAPARIRLGLNLLRQGKKDSAREQIREVLKNDPDNQEASKIIDKLSGL